MQQDRGIEDKQEWHRTPPGRYAVGDARWYIFQGYVILYASGAPDGVCQTIDYRFAPIVQAGSGSNNPTVPEIPSVPEEPTTEESPPTETVVRGVRFVLVDFATTSYGALVVKMRVMNERPTGDIENVACNVHALQDSTIVDTAFVYFANGGTIQLGENAEEYGIFFELESVDDLETTRQECDFLLVR